MLEKLLKIYPEGSDITIMNTMYQKRRQNPETGNWDSDFMVIVYKDNSNAEKGHVIIKNPKYKFYKLKDGISANYSRLFIEKDKVEQIEVPYTKLEKSIAQLLDREDEYNDAVEMRDGQAIRNLHTDPRIFNSDQHIEDHYRFEFSKFYTNNITKIKKGFYDIEVDGIKLPTGMFPTPERAECPINAITYYDEGVNRSFTFLLRNPENPLVQQLEDEYNSGKFTPKHIHDFVQKALGGWKKFKRSGMFDTEFRLYWFDDEITLLKAFFGTVYRMRSDFMMGWNSSGFDFSYIINRISVLGEDPVEICSDPSWETKFLVHYVDQRNINDYAERGDFTRLASDTVWLDQMIQFCSRRKAKMGSFTSFKLDDIANLTAGVRKLDYSHITNDIAKLPYLDYKTFVLYNIIDVVNQKCIENKAQDLEYIFSKCIVNCTHYAKGHRQTVYLINRMTKEWDKLDLVIGNNTNKGNKKPEKYQGALVEDPMTVSDYSKIKIFGTPILLVDNAQDSDFKSLYPSIMIEFNIAPNTQIGRIDIWNKWCIKYQNNIYWVRDPGVVKEFPTTIIDDKSVPRKIQLYLDEEYTTVADIGEDGFVDYLPDVMETVDYTKFYQNENIYHNDKYSRSGEFIENLSCDNIIEFCKRWLSLGGFKEVIQDWKEYMQHDRVFYGSGSEPYFGHFKWDGSKLLETPLIDIRGNAVPKAIVPFEEVAKPLFDFRPMERCGVDKEYARSRVNGIYFRDDQNNNKN